MKALKAAFEPVGPALGAGGGMLAGAAFGQAGKVLGLDEDTPGAAAGRRPTATRPG